MPVILAFGSGVSIFPPRHQSSLSLLTHISCTSTGLYFWGGISAVLGWGERGELNCCGLPVLVAVIIPVQASAVMAGKRHWDALHHTGNHEPDEKCDSEKHLMHCKKLRCLAERDKAEQNMHVSTPDRWSRWEHSPAACKPPDTSAGLCCNRKQFGYSY